VEKWEYKFVKHKDAPWPGNRPSGPSWVAKLNAAGQEGWEAVGTPASMTILMKRRIT
jgi:hypothetical protein